MKQAVIYIHVQMAWTVLNFHFGSAIGGTAWKNVEDYSYIKLDNMESFHNTGAAEVISTCLSVVHCSWKCSSRDSLSLYYDESTSTCHCYKELVSHEAPTDNDPLTNGGVVYGEFQMTVQKYRKGDASKYVVGPTRTDCLQLYEEKFTENGVYTIKGQDDLAVEAYCDMEHGGWTIIQKRRNGEENFYRDWNAYVNGFGKRRGEYWLGLETIHILTQTPSEISIILRTFEDRDPQTYYERYSTFSVGSAATGYQLTISGHDGCSEGDAMEKANGMKFTTKDMDNDNIPNSNCAVNYHGAWWFNGCHACHLNGQYYGNPNLPYELAAHGLTWAPCHTGLYSLKATTMKIRRN